jgi:CheY-like chemotaxis protein
LLAKDTFDLLFLDVRLPDGEGTDLLRELQTHPEKPLVVMVTGFGSVESAVECMRNGAFDYMLKPFSRTNCRSRSRRRRTSINCSKSTPISATPRRTTRATNLQGVSQAMEGIAPVDPQSRPHPGHRPHRRVKAAPARNWSPAPFIAKAPAHNEPFIKVNCAAIPENLIESEFFGHEKGSFTGALNKREGRFELAHNGTILLDEVSEISPQVQAKLLRVLQERELERVGGNRTIKVDVRVLATTNRRLGRKRRAQGISPGPLLPPQRRSHPCPAPARAQGRRAFPGAAIHAPLRPQARRARARLFRLMHGRACKRTAGRATCANCKTSSSAP